MTDRIEQAIANTQPTQERAAVQVKLLNEPTRIATIDIPLDITEREARFLVNALNQTIDSIVMARPANRIAVATAVPRALHPVGG